MLRGLLITLGVAVGIWLLAILILVAFGRKSAGRELATLIPNRWSYFVDYSATRECPEAPSSGSVLQWHGLSTRST